MKLQDIKDNIGKKAIVNGNGDLFFNSIFSQHNSDKTEFTIDGINKKGLVRLVHDKGAIAVPCSNVYLAPDKLEFAIDDYTEEKMKQNIKTLRIKKGMNNE